MTRRWVNDMTVYRVVYISSVLVLMVLMLGCNRTNSDPIAQTNSNSTSASQALIIRPADSPATGDSREPELTATADGRIILSWVEKVGEKRYALRMASRDQTTWNERRTIGEGENWFVNWTDFPSVISLNDGSLAAHWLVKSGTATYATTSTLPFLRIEERPGVSRLFHTLITHRPSMDLFRSLRLRTAA